MDKILGHIGQNQSCILDPTQDSERMDCSSTSPAMDTHNGADVNLDRRMELTLDGIRRGVESAFEDIFVEYELQRKLCRLEKLLEEQPVSSLTKLRRPPPLKTPPSEFALRCSINEKERCKQALMEKLAAKEKEVQVLNTEVDKLKTKANVTLGIAKKNVEDSLGLARV
jgi:hypothetical protein